MRTSLRIIFGIIVLAVVFYILRKIDFVEIYQIFGTLKPKFFLLAFASYSLGMLIFGLRSMISLREIIKKHDFWFFLKTTLAGSFVNVITPGANVGGEPVKAYFLGKRYNRPKTKVFGAILVDRILHGAVSLFFIIASLLFILTYIPVSHELKIIFQTVLFFLLAFLILILLLNIEKTNFNLWKFIEKIGVLLHDLGEEFGRSILGARVVNDIIKYLFGENAGKHVCLLTNNNALLVDPYGRELLELEKMNHDSVYDFMGKKRDNVQVEDKLVLGEYQRVHEALAKFKEYTKNKADYIPDSEKKILMRVVDGLLNDVDAQIRSGSTLSANDIKGFIDGRYNHIISIMEKGDYIDVDKRLILPGDDEFLITLKRTFYRDFIYTLLVGDPSLSVGLEKIAESTDTVANMAYEPLTNALSIQRKARILVASGVWLIDERKRHNLDSERLQRGIDYLFRNLKIRVDLNLRYASDCSFVFLKIIK